MAEFLIPEFLQNMSDDEIHDSMLDVLPEDIDASEGNHVWNLTRPTAIKMAEMCEFILPEVIKLIFPEWSYGEYLDAHAKLRGMARRPAVAATGTITVTGTAGVAIPAGSLFSTTSPSEDQESVDYASISDATIPQSGTVKIDVQCSQDGTIGNTAANTIVLVSSDINGIEAVTNEDPITGGIDEEEDEALIERILAYDQTQGDSYVGNVADYQRWATSVSGVGSATVIPAQDDSGTVTIIITDQDGAPATEELCTAVYNYIMRPDAPDSRKAPVNAGLTVIAPSTVSIGIKATIELEDGATIESVKSDFLPRIAVYMSKALEDGEIKYTRVAAVLAETAGANDFSDLKIGAKSGGTVSYGTANIPITTNILPTVDEIDLVLTSGTV